ncbi:MAG: DUF4279 domain-containing protein [Terriglobales bacterium]
MRGFLAGKERDEDTHFAYSATVRIFGDITDLDQISTRLGLQPTDSHRKGERRDPRSAGYGHDMWSYSPPIDKHELLHKHIDALWLVLKPHKRYLVELKKFLTVDVFLGYRSNSDTAGVEVPHTSLEMFSELQIPFGLSIIVT